MAYHLTQTVKKLLADEKGTIYKPHGDRLRVALAFPNSYRVGMSNLGFQTIYRLDITLPARWVMLDKTLATLSGVALDVYPDLNVFEVARPYAMRLAAERFRPAGRADEVRHHEHQRAPAHRVLGCAQQLAQVGAG